MKKQMICRGKEMRADKIVLWGNAGDQGRDNAHTRSSFQHTRPFFPVHTWPSFQNTHALRLHTHSLLFRGNHVLLLNAHTDTQERGPGRYIAITSIKVEPNIFRTDGSPNNWIFSHPLIHPPSLSTTPRPALIGSRQS